MTAPTRYTREEIIAWLTSNVISCGMVGPKGLHISRMAAHLDGEHFAATLALITELDEKYRLATHAMALLQEQRNNAEDELLRQAAEGQGDCRQCERGVDTCVVHAATPTEPPPPVAQVKRCGTCRHFRRDEGGDTPFGFIDPFGVCRGQKLVGGMGGKLSVPADGSGFCHLHSEGEK